MKIIIQVSVCVLIAVIGLSSCRIISGEDMDENEHFNYALHARLKNAGLAPIDHSETLCVVGTGVCYIPMADSADPRNWQGRYPFSTLEAESLANLMRQIAAELHFSRSIWILEAFTGRTRFIIERNGSGVRKR